MFAAAFVTRAVFDLLSVGFCLSMLGQGQKKN